jgi:serralysin
MAKSEDWCFAWFQGSAVAGKDRQAMVDRSKWRIGDTITISFLDGDEVVRKRVREVAEEWISRTEANLRFAWRDDTNDTLVRITLRGRGQWSLIGTDCKRRDKSIATMALGGLTAASPDADVRRKTLHEFGHLLGMVHEHKLTDAPIQWDRQAVYDELETRWSKQTIDENLLDPIVAGEHNATAFDPESIMIYPISASWTLNGFRSEYNLDLSKRDIEFIRKQYV